MNHPSSTIRHIFQFTILLTAIFAIVTSFPHSPLPGLLAICQNDSQVFTNYFAIGGVGATFLNSLLVQLVMYCLCKTYDSSTFLAYFLTMGFTFWGVNILNIWFAFFGVFLFTVVRKKSIRENAAQFLFATGMAPVYSHILFQYPFLLNHPLSLRILAACLISSIPAILMPFLLQGGKRIHHGYCLYNAGWAIGISAMLSYALLYRILLGIGITGQADGLAQDNRWVCALYSLILFSTFILSGIYQKGWPSYKELWRNSKTQDDDFETYGSGATLLQIGMYGLAITGFCLVTGAIINGVTFGCIFCMIAVCTKGSHMRNAIPIVLGYLLVCAGSYASYRLFDLPVAITIQSQAILTGICFASGLAPLTGAFGWKAGITAGIIHCFLVLSMPQLHGALCLYNGGFTAVLTAAILVPIFQKPNSN